MGQASSTFSIDDGVTGERLTFARTSAKNIGEGTDGVVYQVRKVSSDDGEDAPGLVCKEFHGSIPVSFMNTVPVATKTRQKEIALLAELTPRVRDEFARKVRAELGEELYSKYDCGTSRVIRMLHYSLAEPPRLIAEFYPGNVKSPRETWPPIATIARDVFLALWFLHSRAIMHNDVHPRNFCTAGGRVILIDLGQAHKIGATGDHERWNDLDKLATALRMFNHGKPHTPEMERLHYFLNPRNYKHMVKRDDAWHAILPPYAEIFRALC
jgi:hypothetical protein